jgi:hypothetical protein
MSKKSAAPHVAVVYSIPSMRHADFFLTGDAEPAYRNVRDSEYLVSEREAVQQLWERFQPLLGDDPSHFLRDARVNFAQRLWEMRLACLLVDNNVSLERPPADGPDIKVADVGSPIWIEATVPRRGDGADAVDEPPIRQPYHPDRKRMALRYVSSVEAKAKQRERFLGRDVIAASDPFVVALNTTLVPDSDIEPHGMPDVVRALLGLDRVEYRFAFDPNRGVHGAPRMHYPNLDAVTKASGKEVPLGAFRTDQIASVSAVMFTARHPMQLEPDHIRVFHNPFASNPVARGRFPFAREFWIDGDMLRCSRE